MSDDGEHQRDARRLGARTTQCDDRLVGGRYRLTERIGSGGMGTVWLAVDELVGREVAVKQPRLPGDPDDPDNEERRRAANRLYREARAAARVDHPSAVTIHDVVIDDGHPWIVMEWVRGESLQERLRRGPLTPAESARIGLAVVGALHAAHGVGIVHRDVKPANVLLGPHGQVVLTDFGIAHVQGEESLTMTGEFVGSLEFVAPERMSGHGAAGPPSDLWSLGVLLYAAVEGASPFRRTSPESTLAAILSTEPPAPTGAGPLGPLVVRLLAKDPADRPDAEEAARILTDVAEGRTPDTQLPSELKQLGEDEGTLRLAGERPGAALREEAAPAVAAADPEDAPEVPLTAGPEQVSGDSSATPSVTVGVRGPVPARRPGRRPPRRLVAVGAVAGVLFVGGGVWMGTLIGAEDDSLAVPEPHIGAFSGRPDSSSPESGAASESPYGADTRWVAHREKEMNAVLSLPSSYERTGGKSGEKRGGGGASRTVTYDGEKVIRVRLTQWDKAPTSPMKEAKDSSDIVGSGVKSTAQYTSTSFDGQEAVLADTTHYADGGTPTRVLELIVRTDDSRMFTLRVDMPKGTPDEKKGTAVFKGARERLKILTE
ncbi:serine/threonine-protein kinase [Streptomyces neyagawaensis]|uniref:serine/threonine-protein kinase n=1 Tax=Streptomyces neyagawaensis TaxID=42238 RepID=UPI0007C7A36C|nr:serine/threonine-protein kinase [Streptomyces neyagawaensis]MCL6734232.1 serine/threonine protein kinase [Streptomyces neyagawaensis]MDE1681165.1 serine/threonine-protein kinase [Streptomyces neyagawaensis]